MMTEIKKSLKLIKYGYQAKLNIGLVVLFFILGVLMLILNDGFNVSLGAIYILLGPFMVIQVHYNLLHSNIIASSYQRRTLDGLVPNVVGAVSSLIVYAVLVVFIAIKNSMSSAEGVTYASILIVASLIIFVVIVYYGIAYKIFWVGTGLFVVAFLIAFAGGSGVMRVLEKQGVSIPFVVSALIGLGLIILGNVLSVLLRKALYKKPISPASGGVVLRKAMQ